MHAARQAAPAHTRRTHVAAEGRRPQHGTNTAANPTGAPRCACGGSCPRCQSPEDPLNVLSSPGQALAPSTRAFFEQRFGGEDFGGVRIHGDAAAADSARALGAAAYTAGHHIVFGGSRYEPESAAGGSWHTSSRTPCSSAGRPQSRRRHRRAVRARPTSRTRPTAIDSSGRPVGWGPPSSPANRRSA